MASASGGDPGGGKAPRGNKGDSGDGNSSPGTPKNSRGKLLPQPRGAPEGDKRAPQENPRSRRDRGALGGDNRSLQENPSSRKMVAAVNCLG
ncbi:hypothetical protein BaRGS_00003735 [Batillaria attramentaria]|uniref:Uncharacterized protein n=1 Tax=Batillaria attramentaria TaxID=370345 RepID=A0ABD0M060_9CAEN